VDSITLRTPDDFHVHFRQGQMLAPIVLATARHFRRALVMPNTNPPVLTGPEAMAYAALIRDVAPELDLVMTVKIVPETTPELIREAAALGIRAAKLYPEGVTTGSVGGVRDFTALKAVFAEMEVVGMVLCLHGEVPGEDVFCLDREQCFLDTLVWILTEFPDLKIVMEHLSTAAAADFVWQYPYDELAATITVHHLKLTLDDVIGDKLRPHHFCKPIAKRPHDRERLIQAVTEPGQRKFFLGTDSAPHLRSDKECDCGAAGVFTALTALAELAEIFEYEDALDQLEAFTSINGARFYGLPLNEGQVTLARENNVVPEQYYQVVPYGAGQTLKWKVKED
jgi:dihydroorotase